MSAAPAAALAAFELAGRFDADGVAGTDDEIRDERRDHDTDTDHDPEPPRKIFKGDGHIHAPQACDQRRDGDDQREHR